MAELTGEAKQRYVADMFARISGRYDLMNDLMTAGLHRRWRRKTALLAADGLKGKALDIATGTGDLLLALSRCPGIDHAVGVDLLPEMVSLARAKIRARGQNGKTTLLLGDALSLPFPSGTFDCATAGFSLRNMPDVRRALAEMVRVVRPGGRVATLELTPASGGLKSRLFRWYYHRLVPVLGGIVTGDRPAYDYLPGSIDHFLEAGRLNGVFRELGLIDTGYLPLGFGTVMLHWGRRPPPLEGRDKPCSEKETGID